MSNIDREIRDRVHVFSSFFYRRLSSAPIPQEVDLTTKDSPKKRTGFDLVRSWTRKIDIFSKDFIVVPICENLHWYVAIICYPQQMLQERPEVIDIVDAYDDKQTDDKPRTTILFLDSLGITTGLKMSYTLKRLSRYLVHEAADKRGVKTSRDLVFGKAVRVPKQNNFSDCGCFLLQYVEQFFNGPPEQIYHDMLTTDDYSNWFPPSAAACRRLSMRKRIDELAEDYQSRAALRASKERIVIEDRSSDVEEINIG